MTWAPTTDQILDLDGVRCRADRFRFDLTDQTGTIIGELHPDMNRPPAITNDTTAAVPRSINSVHLPASEGTAVNVITDRLRPVMILQNGAEYPLGVFLWSADSEPIRSWGSEHASTLNDRMVMFNQGLATTVGWAKGADIGLAVLSILLSIVPLDQVVIDEITADLGVGVSHQLGKSHQSVLADFATKIGFLDPYADRDGLIHFVAPPDLGTADPALIYEAGGRIIDDSIAASNDLIKAPNVFRVYENSGQMSLVGEYRIPASAPHSVENRGYEIGDPEAASGLKTQARADAAARALATTRGVTYRWLSFDSTLDPRHDTYDPVTAFGETWLEIRWAMQLRSGGRMSHLLRKVY